MQKQIKKATRKAFSLIELSIVIVIISILITGSLTISKTAISSSKTKITKDRMDAVYQAINTFVAINKRLPCPADLTVVRGTTGYGDEITTTTTQCDGGGFTSSTATNLVYGMVPIKVLGLAPDMAEDGFGTKFSFVVDKRFTKIVTDVTTNDGFEGTQGITANNIIPEIIQIGTEGSITKSSLFALISHGANKYSGFNATSTNQNPAPVAPATPIPDENDNNCNGGVTSTACSTTSDARYNNILISYSTDKNFDDIVLFKTKQDIVRDAGLEFMICSRLEAETVLTNYNWGGKNGNYGQNVASSCTNNNATPATYTWYSRICGRYGVWGPATVETGANCPS